MINRSKTITRTAADHMTTLAIRCEFFGLTLILGLSPLDRELRDRVQNHDDYKQYDACGKKGLLMVARRIAHFNTDVCR